MTPIFKGFSQWLLPQCRTLTVGEHHLARSIFGSHLQLDDIRIYAARWVLKGYAISPNGHIYFNPADWQPDFSTGTIHIQAWFIHELVHVWQVQQGIQVIRKALFNRRYRYQLKHHKPFLQYGIEQQAQMVQDYFLQRAKGQNCDHLAQCIPFISLN